MLINSDSARIPLPDKSIHCVTTSPPYWGLRKYSGEQGRVWGGDPECDHKFEVVEINKEMHQTGATGRGSPTTTIHRSIYKQGPCQKCNAWYGGLGLEPTPDLFIQHMVEIFRDVRRVLRDDGVVWMNLGDSYAGSGGENANTGLQGGDTIKANSEDGTRSGLWRRNPRKTKIQQGNLMMMPHRVAIALQDDGWIIRNDVIWFKRNPMPESVNGWRFQMKCTKLKSGN